MNEKTRLIAFCTRPELMEVAKLEHKKLYTDSQRIEHRLIVIKQNAQFREAVFKVAHR